jgi:hypothetical protein
LYLQTKPLPLVSTFPKIVSAPLQCYLSEPLRDAKFLDCGGKAQRRHRYSIADGASKAAWRFASRRSPKRFGCGSVALRLGG